MRAWRRMLAPVSWTAPQKRPTEVVKALRALRPALHVSVEEAARAAALKPVPPAPAKPRRAKRPVNRTPPPVVVVHRPAHPGPRFVDAGARWAWVLDGEVWAWGETRAAARKAAAAELASYTDLEPEDRGSVDEGFPVRVQVLAPEGMEAAAWRAVVDE